MMEWLRVLGPWLVAGLSILGSIIAVTTAVNKKADRIELETAREECRATTAHLNETKMSRSDCIKVTGDCVFIKERDDIWAEIGIHRRDIMELKETKGEMRAYVEQLRDAVREIRKLNNGHKGR